MGTAAQVTARVHLPFLFQSQIITAFFLAMFRQRRATTGPTATTTILLNIFRPAEGPQQSAVLGSGACIFSRYFSPPDDVYRSLSWLHAFCLKSCVLLSGLRFFRLLDRRFPSCPSDLFLPAI
jgi:hypothetical protein